MQANATKAPEKPKNSGDAVPVHWIDVSVLDAESQLPLSDIMIAYSINYERKLASLVRTDSSGTAHLPIFDRIGTETVFTLRALPDESHLGQSRTWKTKESIFSKLPTDHQFQLKQGNRIGGTVIDFHGKPIANAFILLHQHPRDTDEYGNQSHLNVSKANEIVTDSQGHWQFQGAPRVDS